MFFVEKLINNFDNLLQTLVPPAQRPVQVTNPGEREPMPALTQEEKKHVAGLMRVNHAGEVCAQALYQGQAFTAGPGAVRDQMQKAAKEEEQHLGWCEQRLKELNSKPSILNPFWYTHSFLIGALAGIAGDRWSLGFVMETERQVFKHLEAHINRLPTQDKRSRVILEQMQAEEAQHAQQAVDSGAQELPFLVRQCMQVIAKIMTKTSYNL
jgi:ubiquinone biosynthesis monooxygenase Coq7